MLRRVGAQHSTSIQLSVELVSKTVVAVKLVCLGDSAVHVWFDTLVAS